MYQIDCYKAFKSVQVSINDLLEMGGMQVEMCPGGMGMCGLLEKFSVVYS